MAMGSVDQFCYKTEQLLKFEKDTELLESRSLQQNVSPKLLEKRGVCITGLVIDSRKTSLYGRQIVSLKLGNVNRSELPACNITPGDIVGLNQASTSISISSGIVVKVSSTSISIAFDQNEELTNMGDDCQYYIVKLANDVTYRRLRRALEKLRSDRRGPADSLVDLTFSESSDKACALVDSGLLSYFNTLLDSSQKEAVKLALAQRHLAIIHGPPGTGKSTTVVEVIRQFASQGLKVLACAPSNVAVDNLVLRLAKAKVVVTRLGHPARAMEEIQAYSLDAKISACEESSIVEDIRKDIDASLKKMRQGRGTPAQQSARNELKLLRKELKTRSDEAVRRVLKRSEVILSTLTSATDDGPLRILEEMHFDVVVIDECSQALEAACWIALLQAPKCVLAGDHLQLPPTILSSKAAAAGLSVTLMERLISSHPSHVHMLTVQYRMNSKIMQWASTELYGGKLTASPTVSDHLLKDLTDVEDNDLTCEPLLLIDTADCDLPELELPDEQSRGNEGEADLVAVHVQSLIESGVKASDIAVISPYNLQVELIRNRLLDKHRNLEVKSVDGYQGREKEAVVISLVRSNKKGIVGFLSEDRRLNVAVTRARRQVTIICDSDTVSKHPFLSRLICYMRTNGVVRTAAEYQQDHAIGHISEKVAKLMKGSYAVSKTKSGNKQSRSDNSASTKRTDSSVSTKRKPQEQITQSASKGGRVFSSETSGATAIVEQVKETEEEREQRIREAMDVKISDFMKGGDDVLEFQSTLNSYERMIVHQIAESRELEHVSVGEGSERHIVVKKPSRTESSKETTPLASDQSGQLESAAVDSAPTATAPTVSVAPSIQQVTCTMCGKPVPQSNIHLHRLRCAPVPTTDSNSADAPTSSKSSTTSDASCRPKSASQTLKISDKPKKKKKDKMTVNDGAVLNKVASDDFDALVAAADKLNSVCNFKKCKTLVRTLGVNCQFCKLRFCLGHGMPEVHGCGAAAKTQARATIIKDGRIYSGSGVPDKKPNAATRAKLEKKMNKKLSEFTDQRRPKEKDKQ